MLDEFYDNHVKELSNLVELLKIYDNLIKISENFKSKKFYKYSTQLTVNRINELIGGSEKLRTKFKSYFEKDVENVFDDDSFDSPFKGLE